MLHLSSTSKNILPCHFRSRKPTLPWRTQKPRATFWTLQPQMQLQAPYWLMAQVTWFSKWNDLTDVHQSRCGSQSDWFYIMDHERLSLSLGACPEQTGFGSYVFFVESSHKPSCWKLPGALCWKLPALCMYFWIDQNEFKQFSNLRNLHNLHMPISSSPRAKILHPRLGFLCFLCGALLCLLTLCLQSRLSCCESCNRNSEGRATHVVQADLLADLNGGWISAVLTANAHLHFWPGATTTLNGHGD